MLNKVLTIADIRKDLVEFLESKNMTLRQFIETDLDDIEDINVRDVKLMLDGIDLNKH